MSLIRWMLWGGYLVVFARFCDVNWRLRPFAVALFHGICSLRSVFYCALWRNNYRQSSAGFVARFVTCFVGFSGEVGIGGLDRVDLAVVLGRIAVEFCKTHEDEATRNVTVDDGLGYVSTSEVESFGRDHENMSNGTFGSKSEMDIIFT